MKVMVTLNLVTEADLVNESQGTIENIVLDPREHLSKEDIDQHGVVWPKYPPTMILFQPLHHEFKPFPALSQDSSPYSHPKSNLTFTITEI